MSRKKWLLGIVALLFMSGTGCMLAALHAHQKLGAPGVRTHRIPGYPANYIPVQVDLPENVTGFTSEAFPFDEITTNALPQDTSYGQRVYRSVDGTFVVQARVVLMGTDRASMHKPQFCLEGQGWRIDQQASITTTVHVEQPVPYEMPVVRLVATQGGAVNAPRGIYVYWFVTSDAMSAGVSGFERMWLLAKKMLTTLELQRWAYVSCFTICAPGQEEATFERMKQFIAGSVPQFQLFPRDAQEAAMIRP